MKRAKKVKKTDSIEAIENHSDSPHLILVRKLLPNLREANEEGPLLKEEPTLDMNYRFEDYIKFLRENFVNLVEYRERTGTLDPSVLKIKEDLFDDDPFIVFNATLAATIVLSDKSIYH